jgi:hypothetical protein
MGAKGDKPRKPKRRLPKVPKYEEPNELSMPGIGGGSGFGLRYGRFGHGAGATTSHRPSWPGRAFLRLLGMRERSNDAPEDVDG